MGINFAHCMKYESISVFYERVISLIELPGPHVNINKIFVFLKKIMKFRKRRFSAQKEILLKYLKI